MLGVGLVDFDTAAGDDFDFKFVGINDPAGLATPDRGAPAAACAHGGSTQHGLQTSARAS